MSFADRHLLGRGFEPIVSIRRGYELRYPWRVISVKKHVFNLVRINRSRYPFYL